MALPPRGNQEAGGEVRLWREAAAAADGHRNRDEHDDPLRILAHAFFAGEETAFVNAVLDRLAHRMRAAEFGEMPPDDEPQF